MSEDYLLGTDDSEIRRLGVQHRVWSSVTNASWERAGFGIGQSILDLGAGPGFASLDLAHVVGPSGSVTAFDSSSRFLELLRQRANLEQVGNVETRCGDVNELDFVADTFDGVYARWLMCFLSDPQAVLQRIAHCMRPGATLVVLDYFNYLAMTFAPRSAAMAEVLTAVQASWRDGGGNLEVQGELAGHASACGLVLEHADVHAFVTRPGEPRWEWPKLFFANYVPKLVAQGRIPTSLANQFFADWQEREARADTFLQLPPIYELILRKLA